MALREIHSWLSAQSVGLGTLTDFQRECTVAAEREPKEAAFLQLLAYAAQRFVERYEGAPLPADAAKQARDRLIRMAEIAADAAEGPAEKQMHVINTIAQMQLE